MISKDRETTTPTFSGDDSAAMSSIGDEPDEMVELPSNLSPAISGLEARLAAEREAKLRKAKDVEVKTMLSLGGGVP